MRVIRVVFGAARVATEGCVATEDDVRGFNRLDATR